MELERPVKSEHLPKGRIISQLRHPLPDPDLSFDRHWEILKAYVIASKEGTVPVSYKDFGKLTVSANHISANNKFFESIGLISKVEGTIGKYIPTAAGIAIQRDLTWKKEESVQARMAELISRSWFWESAKDFVSVKSKAKETELIDQLGYDSGADPSKHRPSLAVLIEYLRFSHLLVVQDGMFILGTASPITEPFSDVAIGKTTERATSDSTVPSVGPSNLFFGIFVSPDSSEEQIRKAVRTIIDEAGRTRRGG
jgi:hypothetical protein